MNNRRLIQLFMLVLVIFLSFKVVPMAREWKESLEIDIERLVNRRDQLDRLLEKREEWSGRLDKLTRNGKAIGAQSLPGGRPEVATARLQSLLRGYADEAGVEVSSMSLPEIESAGSWNLLQEVVTMRGTEAEVLGFLDQVESGKKLLRVVGFEMRKDRSKLYGAATVVGFSPLETQDAGNE